MSVIKNRIEKNIKKLAPWAERLHIDAYRIYERDIPEYPFIVDRYKDHFVVYDRSDDALDAKDEKRGHLPELLAAVGDLFAVPEENVILKRRQRQKGEAQYEKTAETGRTMVIREGPARFLINLYDYLDTGLFLDHRLMRQSIQKLASGKDFLNLFAYTGSVSVFAALGGARTVSVDMSATYSNWARENFRLNQIPPAGHEFITENALEFLADGAEKRRFDLIFLDPPTFSNSKKMESSFEVERDQDFLVENAMRLLRPGGTLFFSNNKRSFKLSDHLQNNFAPQDITAKTIPKDFRDAKIHRVYEIKKA